MANLSKDKWIDLILNDKGNFELQKSEVSDVVDMSEVELVQDAVLSNATLPIQLYTVPISAMRKFIIAIFRMQIWQVAF